MLEPEFSTEQNAFCDKLFAQLTEQMQEASFSFGQYSALRGEVQELCLKYFRTNEVCYLEEAYLICHKNNILVEVLLDEVAKLFINKRGGAHVIDRKKKSSEKPKKEKAIYQSCVAIAKLEHLCDLTRTDACERVATLLDKTYPEFRMKASSLDKKQKQVYPDSEINRMLKNVPDGWTSEQKRVFLSQFPTNIPQALKADKRR